MSSTYVTTIASGQDLFTGDTDPNGVLQARLGSFLLRVDTGNVSLCLNLDGVTSWGRVVSPNSSGVISLITATSLLLLDNSATALDVGSTGLTNLLRFITTDGAEQIAYNGVLPLLVNTGGLTVAAGTVSFPAGSLSLSLSVAAAPAGTLGVPLILRVSHPGGNVNADTVLPARAGGFLLIDAFNISAVGAGGTVQVFAGAVANTDAMAVGAVNIITRATQRITGTFASGSTIRVTGAGGPTASSVLLTLMPL